MKKIIIFDIDGTLADCAHRLHHVRTGKKDWKAFSENMDKDKPIPPIVEICKAFYKQDYYILLCTGRNEEHRDKTLAWLEKYAIPFHELRMRKDSDYRSDVIVKEEMIHPDEFERILFVVEDRSRVVEFWRKKGILCLQCAPGDF